MKRSAQEEIKFWEALRADRGPWDEWWQAIAEVCLPRRAYVTEEEYVPEGDHYDRLYDTTAVEACQTLASGHAAYITPINERWFAWGAPLGLRDNDEANRWYQQCGEIALEQIAASNFYTEIHELFLDRSGPGTGAMAVTAGKQSALNFRMVNVGGYSIAEDDEGNVNVMVREFKWTAAQAAQAWGKENLPPKVAECFNSPDKAHSKRFTFLHVVRPRLDRDPRKVDAANMPFEGKYVCVDDRYTIIEEGYEEFPYLVSRFLKWGNDLPYGVSPARKAMPAIHQTQFLSKMMDTLAELAAYPRILELVDQVGEVDLRAAGRTVVKPEHAQLGYPKEWATAGRYDVGKDRIIEKQEQIRRHFHVPLFQMWDQIERQMTATEVAAREREKLLLFSPTFTRLVADMRPMMNRIFGLLLRGGYFPAPPQSVIQQGRDGVGVNEPDVSWQSKIALALKQIATEGFDRMALRLQSIAAMSPDVLDNFDLDVAVRELSRAEGMPSSYLRSESDVAEIRESKAQAAAQQAQIEQAGMAADALGKAAEASQGVDLSGVGV